MPELESLVEKLGRKVQPSDDFYKFSEEDLEDEIMEAIVYLDPDLTPENLTAKDEMLVMYKARSSCYFGLASKHAENMRFQVENDEYHGHQLFTHYMALGEKYEELFNENVGIRVNTVTRTQTGTGRKAGYYPGDTP